MGFPDMPDPKTPAARPTRYDGLSSENVQLGGSSKLSKPNSGKVALTRPRGGAVTASSAKAGVNV